MFNIAPFITKFVRSLHDREENIEIPYSMTQFGVVLMADVVGFSKLTTLATEKGESSPEAISSEIGEYMGECIKIIEFYGGDVVKFLGDALLVSFQPSLTNERRSSGESFMDDGPQDLSQRQRHVLVRKAIECGLQLLARQSHFRVYLTAEEIIRHRGPGGEIQRHHSQKDPQRRLSMFDSLYEGKTGNGGNNGKKKNDKVLDSGGNEDALLLDGKNLKKRSNTFRSQLQSSQTTGAGNTHPAEHMWDSINPFKKKHYDHLLSKVTNRRRSSNISSQSTSSTDIKSIDLELHIAVSCGNVTNIILGDIDPTGAITEAPLFDPQVPTNTGNKSSKSNADIDKNKSKTAGGPNTGDNDGEGDDNAGGSGDGGQERSKKSSSGTTAAFSDYFLRYRGRLEYAIGGEAVESLDKALSAAKAGEISITPEAFQVVNQKTMLLPYEMRDGYYVVKGFDIGKSDTLSRSQQQQQQQQLMAGPGQLNAEYLSDRPGLIIQASQLKIEPLVPKTRDTSFLNLTTDPSLQYFKYLNRSSLYRLQHSVEGNFPAQYREATIMFISLGKIHVDQQDGLQKAQNALFLAIRRLVKYEGMLQQFAVDDKGATILGIFGLPPLSHESEAIFAANAAVKLRDEYRKFLPDFSIALASGGIFNAVLPMDSPYRRDAAIAGDAIIIAVRMLKFAFSRRNIVCDLATRKQIGDQCEFEDFGANFVKGKKEPVQIYGLLNFSTTKNNQASQLTGSDGSRNFVGYLSEMENALGFLDSWLCLPNHHFMVILGHTGSGKSFWCRTLHDQFRQKSKDDFFTCWTSSTEVEKSTKYYTVRNLVISLFELIDTDKVPANTTGLRQNKNTKEPSSTTDRLSALSFTQLEKDASTSSASKKHHSFIDSLNSHHDSSRHSTNRETSGQPLDHINSVDTHSDPPSSISNPLQQQQLIHKKERLEQQQIQEHGEDSNELVDLIIRCLDKCGENITILPLFRDLASDLGNIEDNIYTKHVDGRARDILLTGVIGRMIKYLSRFVMILMICDDMQWTDASSLSMLQYIHEDCKNVMMLFATRLSKNDNLDFIGEFCATGTTSQITLTGLGTSDIDKIILQNCGDDVDRVNPSIVRVVQDRTGGNPLYVTNMAIILKDFDHVTVKNGELIPTSNQFDLENFLGNFNYSRVIKMQFDRLNSNYQEFLTIASCLDQYFSIYEVGAAIQPSNTIYHQTDLKVVEKLLKRYDVYNFLTRSNSNDDTGNINRNDKEASAEYSFLHDIIPKTIYELVSYEHRINLHRCLARYYEKLLNSDNQAQILGKVTRHYLQTDELSKQIYYLQELSTYNMESYLLPEATSQLERIISILMDNEDMIPEFGWTHLSDIYYRLGVCFTMRTELNEGERCLFMALSCLDKSWPKNRAYFFLKFWSNCFEQYKHRHWHSLLKLTRRRVNPELGRRVVDIMRQLSNIYVYTGNGRSFAFTLLVGLNACEGLCDTGSNYTLFLARHSLACWLNEKRHNSVYYMSMALQNMKKDWHADTLTVCASLYFAAGKFHDARSLTYLAIENTRTFGVVTDCQAFYRAVALVVTTRIFEGVLDDCPDDLALMKLMADTARINRDYEAEIWLGVYSLGNSIVNNNLDDCSATVFLLETQVGKTTYYNAIAIHGTLLCYYIRKQNYDLAHTHIGLFLEILPSLTVTPNIFPIYGLIFAVMGFYLLLEDKEMHLITLGNNDGYERFHRGVTCINNAFQQVKLWEFAEPSLYLARAFPYISTGRIVEGYMVLRHGFFEMKFINEIKFLKAYYCSILGKYAFTPVDRMEWTEKAALDLASIGIPTDVYCNDDPQNYYCEGKPADYTLSTADYRPD